MLDLRRMNRVIEVNEKYGYALVEPGVSYMQLYRHLRQIGSKLWIDPAAPAWGGVMGNALEHGAGYTPMATILSCSAAWKWFWPMVKSSAPARAHLPDRSIGKSPSTWPARISTACSPNPISAW
ncbi:FAD-binding protein [Sphingobium scionense]